MQNQQDQGHCCSAAAVTGRQAGYTCLPNWLFGEATAQELVVLLALRYHAPNIHPSLARLAKVSGLGKSTVCRTLTSLKARGWVRTEHRFTESGQSSSTAYHLAIGSPEEEPSPVKSGVPERDSQGVPERDTGHSSAGMGVPQRQGGCPTAGHKEEELKNKIYKPLEPPFIPPAGERRPPAVATHPCHDGDGTSDRDQGQKPWPEPEAAPIRDRDGFLINPFAPPPPITAAAAAAPAAAPDPDPLPLIEPEVWLAIQADPWPEVPAATQPQPQQPNAPRPLPTPADPEPIAPVNPKGTSRKGGFQPVEGDVPAALLPVVRELLAFWASKGGKRTERAWTAQLGQLQRIQDDPAGGTEAVRGQLEAGAQAAVFGKAWQAVTHANWERYGKRVTPIIGSGFNRPPNAMEVAVRAMAAIRRREEEARADAAEMAREDERLLAGVA